MPIKLRCAQLFTYLNMLKYKKFMKKIEIYQKENPEQEKILRKISEEVKIDEINSEKIKKVISDMQYFLEVQPDGAALAAPQIGQNYRIFIVSPNVFKASGRHIEPEDTVFINPIIVKQSKKTDLLDEGCFSVRWMYGEVDRYRNTTITAYNLKGELKEWSSGGLLAQVFQHEIDHLDGILFCDKAINLDRMKDEDIEKINTDREKLEKERHG